jgi:hypothetical protein
VGKSLEPLFYWRIVLVGWGTVIVSTLMFLLLAAEFRRVGPLSYLSLDFAVSIFHGIWIGTAFSIFILIPMLIVWMPIYAVIRKFAVSIRVASTLTAAVSAVVGMMLIGLYVGLTAGNTGGFVMAILPWSLVPMSIAPCLAWFAFKSEEFAGTR